MLGLLDGDGQTLAELAADHVSAQPADGPAASWDEIEAELVTGGPALLTAINERLRRAGARPAATATKLQRALNGRLPAAGAARRPPLTRGSPAGEVVLGYVRGQVAAIATTRWSAVMSQTPCTRCGWPPPGTQRAAGLRRHHRPGRDPASVPELKWLATELGAARDGEVMLDRLTADLAAIPPALVAGPVQARITDCFTAELARAGQSTLAALDGQRYLRLLDALDALLADRR